MDSLIPIKVIPKNAKNTTPKVSLIPERPATSLLTTDQRIHALANIIVDRILENHKHGTLELST
jgi:hypothetical protein